MGKTLIKSAAFVTVVIPTYNEADNLPTLLSGLFGLKIPNLHLVVVDDGSPDGTGELAKNLGLELNGTVKVIQRGSKKGLGTAYMEGFKEALLMGSDIIIQMDADLSHELQYVPKFLEALEKSDVVVGSRYISGGGVSETWSISRRILSSIGNFGIRIASGVKVQDATSGFKAFRAEALASFNMCQFRSKGFAFQVEVAYACEKRGFIVREHPIVFAERSGGKSKMSLFIILEALWNLPTMRWKMKM